MISNNLPINILEYSTTFSIFINLVFKKKFQDNYTALHLAVEAGKPAVVESVLGHGAQVHIRGRFRHIFSGIVK